MKPKQSLGSDRSDASKLCNMSAEQILKLAQGDRPL
jgi:hypothetical protein